MGRGTQITRYAGTYPLAEEGQGLVPEYLCVDLFQLDKYSYQKWAPRVATRGAVEMSLNFFNDRRSAAWPEHGAINSTLADLAGFDRREVVNACRHNIELFKRADEAM
jgi:hypothetical protein